MVAVQFYVGFCVLISFLLLIKQFFIAQNILTFETVFFSLSCNDMYIQEENI